MICTFQFKLGVGRLWDISRTNCNNKKPFKSKLRKTVQWCSKVKLSLVKLHHRCLRYFIRQSDVVDKEYFKRKSITAPQPSVSHIGKEINQCSVQSNSIYIWLEIDFHFFLIYPGCVVLVYITRFTVLLLLTRPFLGGMAKDHKAPETAQLS